MPKNLLPFKVFFNICHVVLGKTKKKLGQNQGPLIYKAGDLPVHDDVQLHGNVNSVSITIELTVLNFRFDLFDCLVAENSLSAINSYSLWGFVVQIVPQQKKAGGGVLCNLISKCVEKY